MIAMTTSNSIRVKPGRVRLLMINPLLIEKRSPSPSRSTGPLRNLGFFHARPDWKRGDGY